jgi:hypothetical protein
MIKYLAVAAVACSFACAGYQAKLNDAMAKAKDIKAKVECRAKVLDPYVNYILEQDIPAYLDGADITTVLEVADVVVPEFDKIKAEFKACSAAE